jgi:hypothetical protein
MTSAYDVASNDDLTAWTNLISDYPWSGFYVGNAFYNLSINDDIDQLNKVVQAVDLVEYFYSPTNPPPAPPAVTLTAMIDAYNSGSDDEQRTFAQLIADKLSIESGTPMLTAEAIATALSTGTNEQLNAIAGDIGIPPEDGSLPPVVNVQNFITTLEQNNQVVTTPLLPAIIEGLCFEFAASLRFGPGVNSVDLILNPVTHCIEIVGIIYLGDPPVTNEPTTDNLIASKICLGGELNDNDIHVPVGDTTAHAYFTFAMMQNLFRKLDQLLRCCPPCQPEWVVKDQFTGLLTSDVFLDHYLARVSLHEIETVVAIDEFRNDPAWKRYGRVVWHDADGRNWDGGYIRYDFQVFEAPSPRIVSVSFSLDRGVKMEWSYQLGGAVPAGSP